MFEIFFLPSIFFIYIKCPRKLYPVKIFSSFVEMAHWKANVPLMVLNRNAQVRNTSFLIAINIHNVFTAILKGDFHI